MAAAATAAKGPAPSQPVSAVASRGWGGTGALLVPVRRGGYHDAGRRRRTVWKLLAVWTVLAAAFGAAVALPWLFFLLSDPRTVSSLAQFTIHNSASSSLRAPGISSPGTPGWDRPAQLLLGGGVALVAVQRGRWAADPLAVVAARLLHPADRPGAVPVGPEEPAS